MASGQTLEYVQNGMSQLTNYVEEIERQIEVSRMLLGDLPERIKRMESLLLELKQLQSREAASPVAYSSRPGSDRFSTDSTAKAALEPA
jgi:hypothetical protein